METQRGRLHSSSTEGTTQKEQIQLETKSGDKVPSNPASSNPKEGGNEGDANPSEEAVGAAAGAASLVSSAWSSVLLPSGASGVEWRYDQGSRVTREAACRSR